MCVEYTFIDFQPDTSLIGTTVTIKYNIEHVGKIYPLTGVQVLVPDGMPPQFSSGTGQMYGDNFVMVGNATGFSQPEGDSTYPYTITGQINFTVGKDETLSGDFFFIMNSLAIQSGTPTGTITNQAIEYASGTGVQIKCP